MQIMIRVYQTQPENVQYFEFFIIIRNCEREFKSSIVTAKAALTKKDFFPNKFELGLKTILVKCFIWVKACMVLKIVHYGK